MRSAGLAATTAVHSPVGEIASATAGYLYIPGAWFPRATFWTPACGLLAELGQGNERDLGSAQVAHVGVSVGEGKLVGLISALEAMGDRTLGGIHHVHPVFLDVGRKPPAPPGSRAQVDQPGIRFDRRADLVPGAVHHRNRTIRLGRHVSRAAQGRELDRHGVLSHGQVLDLFKLLGVDQRDGARKAVGHIGMQAVGGKGDLVVPGTGGDVTGRRVILGVDDRNTAFGPGLAVVSHPQVATVGLQGNANGVLTGGNIFKDLEVFQVHHGHAARLGHAYEQALAVGAVHPVLTAFLQVDHGVQLGDAADPQQGVDHRDGPVVVHDQNEVLVEIDVGLEAEHALQIASDPVLAADIGFHALDVADPHRRLQGRDGRPGGRIGDRKAHLGVFAFHDRLGPHRPPLDGLDGKLHPHPLVDDHVFGRAALRRFGCGAVLPGTGGRDGTPGRRGKGQKQAQQKYDYKMFSHWRTSL